MKKVNSSIEGVFLVEPKVFTDSRGTFSEVYKNIFFEKTQFIQENESLSLKKGTMRGLHLQVGEHAQAKLVRTIKGKILDVVVDLRKGSKTYLKWESFLLDDQFKKSLFVPRGFAHGFLTLVDDTIVCYKVDNVYNPSSEVCISFDDPKLAVNWFFSNNFLRSKKDEEQSISLEKYINEYS